MKKVVSLILAMCILTTGIISVVYADEAVVALPVFSSEGGIYTESFTLTINGSGNSVYYTLDGSLPDEKSLLYSEPIEIAPVKVSPRSIQGRVAQERWEKASLSVQ